MTSPIELQVARAIQVSVTGDALSVDLADGGTISVPLAWFPRLLNGRPEERQNWRLIGDGQASFKRWLEGRGAATVS